MNNKIKVWDASLRIFHWSMVMLVFALVITAYSGFISIHLILGQILLAFVLFRIIWGFVGNYYARFSTGIRVILKGNEDGYGHSRLGWLSTFAIYGLLSAHIITGLCAQTDEAMAGPLARHFSYETGRTIAFVHAEIISKLLFAMIISHLLAIIYYRARKNPYIIKAMFSGKTVMVDDNQGKSSDIPLWYSIFSAVMALILISLIVNF